MRQLTTLLLFMLLTLANNAYSEINFKHFSDYIDLAPTKKSDPSICRIHYHAKQKINDRVADPDYKNNQWKLVMRRHLFDAEVDTAMSKLYRYFLGYSTDLDYVEEKGDYYLARREFKHFDKWDKGGSVKKTDSQYFVKDYSLQDDGTLIKGNTVKRISGLASIVALSEFFADIDSAYYNYGAQETDHEVRFIDYDLEQGFSFEEDRENPHEAEQRLIDEFGIQFINMSWYQQEKKNMQEKIAETDFAVIEKIVRDNVANTEIDSTCIKHGKNELHLQNNMQRDVDKIIEELRLRHNQLRKAFN